jgi:ribosomal protein S8
MKPKPLATQSKTFANYVESNFNKLLRKVQNKSKQEKLAFDEDAFMDTIVKCLTSIDNNIITDSDIEKYFWKAYKRNVLSKLSKEGFKDVLQIDELNEDDDVADEEYNEDVDKIIDTISFKIKQEFGVEIYDAWILHVCHDYTYKELEKQGFNATVLHNEFRQIKRYLEKSMKNDKCFITLLKENNFI